MEESKYLMRKWKKVKYHEEREEQFCFIQN